MNMNDGWKRSYGVRVGRDKADTTDLIFTKVATVEFQLYANEAAHLRDLLNSADIPGYPAYLAAPTPLVWTDAKPTVPGLWLWRSKQDERSQEWRVIVLVADEKYGIVQAIPTKGTGLISGTCWPLPDGQFAGPIPQPEEPRK